ncbi:hypothetical protein J6A31_03745 [bacterium]|nr:hypothetical protein [bacterium]
MNKEQIIQEAINKAHDMAKQLETEGFDYMTLVYATRECNREQELVFSTIPYIEASKDSLYTYLHANNLTEVFTLDLKNKE